MYTQELPPPATVPEILRAGAETYEQRAQVYGENYKHFGNVMKALFPKGIDLVTAEDFTKFGLIVNCTTKLARYCGAFANGNGHKDSAHDLCVYAAMLEEMTKPEPNANV